MLSRSLVCSQAAGTEVALAALHEGGFVLKDGECLLQACDLSLTALLAFLVRLWLRNAAILDFGVVLIDCVELSLLGGAVGGHLGDALVEALELLCLVLDVLVFGGLGHGIFLCHLIILGRRVALFGLLCRQVLRKITLANLQDVDDALASSSR